MADKADVIEMFSIFRALELANGPVLSPLEKLDAVASVWADVLDDVPASDLKAAAKEHARNSSFWPKPADIRRLCLSVNRKQLEAKAAKESGVSWFSKVMARAGAFGPNATGSMEHVNGTLATYRKSSDPWGIGRANLIREVSGGNPAVHAAVSAGIDAVGWRVFHEEGWKYRENRMRDVFEGAFTTAYEKYMLEHPTFNVIDFQERKRIVSEGAW